MLIFAFVVSLAMAAVIPFSWNDEHYVLIPVIFQVADSSDTVEGFVELEFGILPVPLTRHSPSLTTFVSGYISPISELFCERFQGHPCSLSRSTNTMRLTVEPGSRFARSSFVVYPASADEGILEIQPADPSVYALDNQIFFSNPSDDTFAWVVSNTTVRLSTNEQLNLPVTESSSSGACKIDGTQNFLMIPNHVLTQLLELMTLANITTHIERSGAISLQGVTDTALDSLPNIQIIMQANDGRHVSLATIGPPEYISADRQRLELRTWRSASNDCTINYPILKNLVVFFDSRNNRIGFGEPLNTS